LSLITSSVFIRISLILSVSFMISLTNSSTVYAMGKIKDKVSSVSQSKNKVKEQEKKETGQLVQVEEVDYSESADENDITKVELTIEQKETQRRVHKLIEQRQFEKAYEVLNELPENGLTSKERKMKKDLSTFQRVEELAKENEAMFKKDESLDPATTKTVKRLYRGAQESILNDQDKLAKDLLIQSLFLDRRNIRSKKLLELGLDSPLGSYKVENVEAKYWKQSLISFRSGFPGKAIEDLKVLEYFDPENPEVFERMGSFYYTVGKTQEAIDAWKRALYLDPGNKDLAKFISNAEKEIERQEKLAKERARRKKDVQKTAVDTDNFQLLRVVPNANIAYSYAQEVRQQMPGRKVVVEETDDGRFAVKIDKPSKKE